MTSLPDFMDHYIEAIKDAPFPKEFLALFINFILDFAERQPEKSKDLQIQKRFKLLCEKVKIAKDTKFEKQESRDLALLVLGFFRINGNEQQ